MNLSNDGEIVAGIAEKLIVFSVDNIDNGNVTDEFLDRNLQLQW
jgi:hypothetical protein